MIEEVLLQINQSLKQVIYSLIDSIVIECCVIVFTKLNKKNRVKCLFEFKSIGDIINKSCSIYYSYFLY